MTPARWSDPGTVARPRQQPQGARGRSDSGAVAPARPLLLEFVGLAGAGKSTLLTAMQRRRPDLRWLQRARRWQYLPVAVGEAARFAPALLAAIPLAPRFAWRTARYYLRLETLRRIIERELRRASGPLVLEHGPVYTLARIAASGTGTAPPRSLEQYATRSLARWAPMLSLVVSLTADPEVIAERVHDRSKAHPMRGSSATAMSDFLERYDRGYTAVLTALAGAGGPPVLTVRTDRETVPALADRLLAALDDARRVR